MVACNKARSYRLNSCWLRLRLNAAIKNVISWRVPIGPFFFVEDVVWKTSFVRYYVTFCRVCIRSQLGEIDIALRSICLTTGAGHFLARDLVPWYPRHLHNEQDFHWKTTVWRFETPVLQLLLVSLGGNIWHKYLYVFKRLSVAMVADDANGRLILRERRLSSRTWLFCPIAVRTAVGHRRSHRRVDAILLDWHPVSLTQPSWCSNENVKLRRLRGHPKNWKFTAQVLNHDNAFLCCHHLLYLVHRKQLMKLYIAEALIAQVLFTPMWRRIRWGSFSSSLVAAFFSAKTKIPSNPAAYLQIRVLFLPNSYFTLEQGPGKYRVISSICYKMGNNRWFSAKPTH